MEALPTTATLTTLEKYLDQFTLLLLSYGWKILLALLILLVGRWLIGRVVAMLVRVLNARKVEQTLVGFLEGIVYYALLLTVVIAAAGQLGIQTTSFLAVLGAASLAVGLALKDSLANFSSGMMLILFRPFKVNDWVTIGGETGRVEQISVFSTILITGDNQKKIIPNGAIANATITNITAMPTRRVEITVGIGYEDDLLRAKGCLAAILAAEPRIHHEPESQIAVSALAESSVNLVVRCWVAAGDFWPVTYHLLERIKLDFDREGITIPYPQRTLHMLPAEPRGAAEQAVVVSDGSAPA